MATQMIFAGFGGQGVLFTGKVAAYAGLLNQQEVSWLPSYGPEMRGGTANCSVCLSEEPIGSPLVTEPDVLVAMNMPSFLKFVQSVKPGGKVVYDSDLVENTSPRKDISFFPIAATNLAQKNNLEGISNIILLGKMLREVPFVTSQILTKALEQCIPAAKKHLLEPNLLALSLGLYFA